MFIERVISAFLGASGNCFFDGWFFKFLQPVSHRILNLKSVKNFKSANQNPKVINCHLLGDFSLANFEFLTDFKFENSVRNWLLIFF
jgi:hypothetical protein